MRRAPIALPRILREMHRDLERNANNLAWTCIDGRFHRLPQAAHEIEKLYTEASAFRWVLEHIAQMDEDNYGLHNAIEIAQFATTGASAHDGQNRDG